MIFSPAENHKAGAVFGCLSYVFKVLLLFLVWLNLPSTIQKDKKP